jgi:hypothetical protein
MSDAVVKIGAIVSTDQLQEGMATNAEAVQAATRNMGVSFQEMSSKAQASAASANRAFTSISADTKAAAAGLSDQALKEATLAKARIAANTEVRTSIKLMTNEQFDQAKATALYAAASEKVVSIDAQIVAAHKEAAAAAEKAAFDATLSTNVWIASMQRLALGVREATGEVQERFVQMAETAKLSEASIGGGFSALGGLLGAAIGVGFAAHFLDDLAKMNVELDHLSAKTGISISSLSGLQLLVKEMGGDFEPVALGLVKMERAQALAVGGNKALKEAFHSIGIEMEELRGLKTEELLQRIAEGFETHNNHALQAAVVQAIFGRGAQVLIPILREQGSALGDNIKKAAEMTGVTDKSAEAARRWTKDMADLSAEAKSVMMPVLEHAEDVIAGVAGAFEVAAAIIFTAGEAIVRSVQAIGLSVGAGIKLVFDVQHMDFDAAKADAEKIKNGFVDSFKSGFADVKDAWGEALSRFKAPPKMGELQTAPEDDLGSGLGSGGGGKKDHAAQERMLAMETEYGELQQAHKLTLKEEHDFWAARIGEFARGTEQYKALAQKLGQIDQEGAKKAGSAIAQFKSGDAVGAMDSLTGAKKTKPQEDGQKEIAEGLKATDAWKLQMAEDLMQTGERWREYHAEVARGVSIEAQNAASLQLARISAAEAEGMISKLAAAHRIATIHAAEEAAKLKELDQELKRIAADQNLTPVQRATQTQGVQNQIAQVGGQGKLQGQQDQAAINAAVAKPYLTAFNAIDAGWKKVQNDLIAGNKNIGLDFAQMGVTIVQKLAGSFEEMIANHVRMWVKMQVTHAAAVQAGVAIDATGAAESTTIKETAGLKQMLIDAKAAAVSGWKAGMALPFPENVVMAPTLAAIGLVGAMSYFEEGGVVTGGNGAHVPILAKQGERILSTSQTNNFETLVNGNNAGRGGNTSSIRANVTQHFHGAKASSANETRKTIQQLGRRGKLSLA